VTRPVFWVIAFELGSGLISPEFNGERVDYGVVDYDFHGRLVVRKRMNKALDLMPTASAVSVTAESVVAVVIGQLLRSAK